MSAATIDPQSDWDELLHTWRELDVPDGWRAEIVGEQITVTPPPDQPHNLIADLVHGDLRAGLSRDLGIFQTLGLAIPLLGKLYIPDLAVVPRAEVAKGDGRPILAEQALLVAEITSRSNAEVDRTAKLWGYAHAPVPLYLLIDRFDEAGPAVTVYSEPTSGYYQRIQRLPFGESLSIPEPVALMLDTAEF